MSKDFVDTEDAAKPRRVSRTVVKTTSEDTSATALKQTVKTQDTPLLATTVQNDDLKAKLRAVLQEDPGVAAVMKNPWVHDLFVQKLKALVD